MAGSNRKRARTPKTSKGENSGARKMRPRLTDVQKVCMSKGMYATIGKPKTKRARKILAAKGHGDER